MPPTRLVSIGDFFAGFGFSLDAAPNCEGFLGIGTGVAPLRDGFLGAGSSGTGLELGRLTDGFLGEGFFILAIVIEYR